ncbi:ATP-binding cassette domain-containing protein [Mycoplasma sp. 1012]
MKWSLRASKKYTILYIIAEIINVISTLLFGILMSYASSLIYDAIVPTNDKYAFFKSFLIVIIFILATDFFTKFSIWWRVRLEIYFRMKLINKLIENVFNKFINSTAKNSYEFDSAKIFSIIFNDSNLVFDQVILTMVRTIGSTIGLIASLISAGLIGFYLIPIILIIVFFSVLLSLFFNKKQTKKQKDYSNARTEFLQVIDNYLNGFKILFYNNKTHLIYQNSREKNWQLYKASLKVNNAQALNEMIPERILRILQFVSIITMAILLFLKVPHITIFTLTFINFLFPKLITTVPSYISGIKKIKTSKKIIEKIEFNIEKDLGNTLEKEIEKIELKNINFSYKNGKNLIFNNFNFSFEQGKKYFIKGASGTGKSTLLKLILGIEQDYEGQILVNKADLKTISDSSYKNKITYLNSENIIFDEEIYKNVSLWEQNNDEKVIEALKKANLWNEVQQKIEHKESAIALSEGQKQRLSLARVFYLNRKFLVFDEVFSNLDKKNIEIILDRLIEDKEITLILVNHNLDLKHYDKFEKIIDLNNL